MKILVFGGTVEGRTVAETLEQLGMETLVCVATDYGASLLREKDGLTVHAGRMDREKIAALLEKEKPDLIVDATHPYSREVSKNITETSEPMGIPYLRVERELEKPYAAPQFDRFFETFEEAADYLSGTEGNILITTGSKEMKEYTKIRDFENRCFIRALPSAEVLEKAEQYGIPARNLLLMQGPFTAEMNLAMLHQTGARFLMTRNSGTAGGFSEKCEAAEAAGAALILIGRPKERNLPENGKVMDLQNTLEYLKKISH